MMKTKDEELLETMCSGVHDLRRWSELTPKGATEYLLHFAHVMEAGVAMIEELQIEVGDYKREIYDLRNKMI
jgi:hypothetical protein